MGEGDMPQLRMRFVYNMWFRYRYILLAFLVSMVLVYMATHTLFSVVSWIFIVIITLLIYLIFSNTRGVEVDALGDVLYPLPPHLGLNGVSVEVGSSS